MKPKTLNFSDRKTKKTKSNNEDFHIDPFKDSKITSREPNQKNPNINTQPQREGLFSRLNKKLNKMSKLKFYSIITVIVLLIAYFFGLFTPITNSLFKTNSVIVDGDTIEVTKDCEHDLLNPLCWPNQLVPQLKQNNNLTNALIVGLDAREGETSGNTDTIILASFDHTTGKTLLISFPRDLYVTYNVAGSNRSSKINAIYALGERHSQIQDGLKLLEESMEGWFDIEIQYSGIVSFNTVKDVVDSVGGITVTLDHNYTDLYPYVELSEDLQKTCSRAIDFPAYCVFKFTEGEHELDGEMALIYSRMRKYTSDFDRARRQQEVINAVKEKFLSEDGGIKEKAQSAWNIYKTVTNEENVKAEISFNDMLAGLLMIDDVDLNPISVVLDPNFGEPYKYMFEGRDANNLYVIKLKGNNFDKISEEIIKIRKNPDVYENPAKVAILNNTGEKFEENDPAILLKDTAFFTELNIVDDGKVEDNEKIAIYVFDDTKIETIDYLKEYFETDNVYYVVKKDSEGYIPDTTRNEIDDVKKTGYKEDIKVQIMNVDSSN